MRKSTKYPGGPRVISRYTRVLRKIPGILPIWPINLADFGPKPASDSAQCSEPKFDDSHGVFPGNREEKRQKRGCCREKRKRRGARGKPQTAQGLTGRHTAHQKKARLPLLLACWDPWFISALSKHLATSNEANLSPLHGCRRGAFLFI